jgi:hypothetical protein
MVGLTNTADTRPYFAIRLACVLDWKYEIFTLVVKPVASHEASALNVFVRSTLEEFFDENCMPVMFNTTDGAPNMVKLSCMLGHSRETCVAHSLHNLLQVDTLDECEEISSLIAECKSIVKLLHFKGHAIADKMVEEKEKEIYKMMQQLIEEINDPDEGPSTIDLNLPEPSAASTCLCNSVPTHWNSTLTMISSILEKSHAVY